VSRLKTELADILDVDRNQVKDALFAGYGVPSSPF
jgi:hypothetical protein